jgi:hypothetical protein
MDLTKVVKLCNKIEKFAEPKQAKPAPNRKIKGNRPEGPKERGISRMSADFCG